MNLDRPVTFRVRADETCIVDLRPETRRAIADEAAFRGQSPERFLSDLLDAVARGDQFSAVLEAGRGG